MINTVTLGAGCFWCIEACFKDIEGVTSVNPGYTGGTEATANYNDVCSGRTDHVEVARIEFDTDVIKFEKLLEMFWFVHDPTQVNRQGNDWGAHYKSAIFYHTEEQRVISERLKKLLDDEGAWDLPIVTEITPITEFYLAEFYHSNYLENNPSNPYCLSVVRPKVDKFKNAFPDLLK